MSIIFNPYVIERILGQLEASTASITAVQTCPRGHIISECVGLCHCFHQKHDDGRSINERTMVPFSCAVSIHSRVSVNFHFNRE